MSDTLAGELVRLAGMLTTAAEDVRAGRPTLAHGMAERVLAALPDTVGQLHREAVYTHRAGGQASAVTR